jgi:hypothetical protein
MSLKAIGPRTLCVRFFIWCSAAADRVDHFRRPYYRPGGALCQVKKQQQQKNFFIDLDHLLWYNIYGAQKFLGEIFPSGRAADPGLSSIFCSSSNIIFQVK